MDIGVSVGLAFIAGLASFLSPCVFSLVPAYISYLSGRSVASAQGAGSRWTTVSHGLAFVLGFSLVFISLGVATSAIGSLVFDLRPWLTRIGGVVVIVFGIHMTGLFRIPFLEVDLRRQTAPDRSLGYLSSALMGVFFSAGWSPCVGPILGAILTLSFSGGSVTQGVALLSAYSAGLAIPFLLAATQIGLVTKAIRRYGKVMRYIEIGMGILLIVIGALMLMGRFAFITSQLSQQGLFGEAADELAVGRIMLIVIIVAGVLGIVPAAIAQSKGRSFVDWWLFGAALFVIALPASLLLKPSQVAREDQPS
jgi:cytochrome c-type biogenesis protein